MLNANTAPGYDTKFALIERQLRGKTIDETSNENEQ
jgi:hypothetical protein